MKYILTFLLILNSCVFASPSNEKELEKVSLQLHWKYQFEFAGFIAAKEKGFYEELGLDVELKEYEFGINIEKDVLDGKSDYGIYNSLSLVDYLAGQPIKLVASFFKRAALVLVTTPDIHSPRDLVGKKIMAGTKEDFILNFGPYFDGYGISVDDVELVPHSYNIDDFVKGEVPAMTAFISNEVYKLDAKNAQYNILDPSEENLYVLQMELFTSDKEAKEHPKRVAAFKAASIRGWQYALSHKEELVNIIHKKYSSALSKEDIMGEAKGVEKLILPFAYDIGSIDRNFLNKQIKLYKNHYKIGRNKNLDDFIFRDKKHNQKIDFSDEEKKYIKENPQINLCLQYGQYPTDGFEHGKFVGIMSDVYALISKSTSLKFNPIISTSNNNLKFNMDSKNCKLLSVYATNNKRYKTLSPTKPFSKTYFTLLSNLNSPFISDPESLKGKILVTQLESFKAYLENIYPYLNIEVEDDKNKMIEKLITNKADAIIILDQQSDYIVNKYGYGKLKVNGFLAKNDPLKVSIGVQKSDPLLLSIIQKALNTISQDKLKTIQNSWRIVHYQKSTDYSLVWKILFGMSVIFAVMIYYQRKLRAFNKELENTVADKTKKLRQINESLEVKVREKIDELIKKDEILTMQSKQAVMGEMISMVAHQWRQPLNTITLQISNIQIKHMMGNDIDRESLDKTMNEINDTINYLSETVDDFQTYFHPDKEVTKIELRELIDRTTNFIKARFTSHNINLLVNIPSESYVNVYMNELIQVLLNILNNSIDAYENSDMKDKLIEISTRQDGDRTKIYIKDSAGGISKESIKQVFEPYFSTKGKNGTGLGLYMSQMIIEKQFQGKISVHSVHHETIFTVEFKSLD